MNNYQWGFIFFYHHSNEARDGTKFTKCILHVFQKHLNNAGWQSMHTAKSTNKMCPLSRDDDF